MLLRRDADRAQVEFLRSEVERARTRVESAQLRSPISGIVITPNLQNSAGKHLDAGTQFAQVLDLSSAVLQIAVPERDTPLMSAGLNAALKLDSYPQRTWHGRVSVVSPEAGAGDGERTFSVEVPLSNPDAKSPRRHDGPRKDFDWLATGRLCLVTQACAVDMADSMELDRVVMQMTLNRCCRVHSVAAFLFSALALMFVAGCDSQAPPQAASAAVVENRTIAKNPPPRAPIAI